MEMENILFRDEIINKVKEIMSKDITNEKKRLLLNELENKHYQEVFIKTHLCSHCGALDVEIWFKEEF